CGVAVLSIHDSFPGGELGHFATRLAEQGLIALVCGNSPALMAAYDSTEADTGTNPLAFALPHSSGPRVFDQASSATAFVSIRQAAERGEHIPPGWALDADGQPTIDPAAALTGALLPFGGAKGANIAMMIELLAAMSGGPSPWTPPPSTPARVHRAWDCSSRPSTPPPSTPATRSAPRRTCSGCTSGSGSTSADAGRPAPTSRSPRTCTRRWPPPPTTSESRQHEKHPDHPYRRRPRRGAARAGGHRGSAHRPRRDHGRA